MSVARAIVEKVVHQHVEDAVILFGARDSLCAAPHAGLLHLRRFDDRLAAHLDALSIAGEATWPLCEAALADASPGAAFIATVRALQEKREDLLQRLLLLAQSVPECRRGCRSAFGWLEREQLRGVVADLLNSPQPARRLTGIAASAMHRVDPGLLASRRMEDADPVVRARALRTAGELGKRELVSALASAILDEDPACQFWGAWSAVLLGDRHNALEYLRAAALAEGPLQSRAFQLALQALPPADVHALLQQIAKNPANLRKLIQGAGLSGDLNYIPWLVGHMANDELARPAGEAFSMLTGADLALLDLERKPPQALQTGPNDDPEDANVEMDADDGLPWPDQALVHGWWTRNGPGFAQGARHFMGAPLAREHCIAVLKNGYQRQRIAAAYHLCLLNPGTPLFEWRAPAWRQQRELAQLA